jgi:hypothetical protein
MHRWVKIPAPSKSRRSYDEGSMQSEGSVKYLAKMMSPDGATDARTIRQITLPGFMICRELGLMRDRSARRQTNPSGWTIAPKIKGTCCLDQAAPAPG